MTNQRIKVDKESVHYQLSTGDECCGNCGMFNGFGIGSCDLVIGVITAPSVCNKWVAKAA